MRLLMIGFIQTQIQINYYKSFKPGLHTHTHTFFLQHFMSFSSWAAATIYLLSVYLIRYIMSLHGLPINFLSSNIQSFTSNSPHFAFPIAFFISQLKVLLLKRAGSQHSSEWFGQYLPASLQLFNFTVWNSFILFYHVNAHFPQKIDL